MNELVTDFAQGMMPMVLDAALKGTVILAGAWISTQALRRASADLRHRIWLAGLAGMALLLIPAPLPDPIRITVNASLDSSTAATQATQVLPGLPLLWLLGTVLILLRFSAGVVGLWRITRGAESAEGTLFTDRVRTPLTWGFLRPVILLPSYMREWSAQERAIVVSHERAHIDRGDWLWQSCAQLLCAVFWFHPVVWFAAARLRQEAEQATDDRVLTGGAAAADYAASLMGVARKMRRGSAQTAVAVTMVHRSAIRKSAISGRIEAILDASRARALAGRRLRVTVPVLAMVAALSLAACAGNRVYSTENGVTAQSVENDVTAPSVKYQVEPEYSEEARKAKFAGKVMLSIVVDEEGLPQNIRVVRKLGLGLDEKAIEAVQKWHFNPGMKDGKPVPVAATIEVIFRQDQAGRTRAGMVRPKR